MSDLDRLRALNAFNRGMSAQAIRAAQEALAERDALREENERLRERNIALGKAIHDEMTRPIEHREGMPAEWVAPLDVLPDEPHVKANSTLQAERDAAVARAERAEEALAGEMCGVTMEGCPLCRGTGKTTVHRGGPGHIAEVQDCSLCGGSGEDPEALSSVEGEAQLSTPKVGSDREEATRVGHDGWIKPVAPPDPDSRPAGFPRLPRDGEARTDTTNPCRACKGEPSLWPPEPPCEFCGGSGRRDTTEETKR